MILYVIKILNSKHTHKPNFILWSDETEQTER
jgi:hypothetical protein